MYRRPLIKGPQTKPKLQAISNLAIFSETYSENKCPVIEYDGTYIMVFD